MVDCRILERPAFSVAGEQTWISGQDNSLFGQFWERCRADGTLERLARLSREKPGVQTGGVSLGISRAEVDPTVRAFNYMIAVEVTDESAAGGLEICRVPASNWAVFTCRGRVPDSIVEAEIYAFSRWLPGSPYEHANAPEMEVYLPGEPGDDYVCEFWLPIRLKG